MNKIMIAVSTLFGLGKFPVAPGTLTSLFTAAIFFLFNRFLSPGIPVQIAAIILIFIIGIPAASRGEKHFGTKDPRPIVIDEVAGQMVSLLWVPTTVGLYILGFFIFRFFDIIKPFPVGLADRKLSGGFGIMADDIAAGLFALGTIHLILHFWPKIF